MLYDLFLILLAIFTGQLVAELKVLSDMVEPSEDDEGRSFESRWVEPPSSRKPQENPGEGKS